MRSKTKTYIYHNKKKQYHEKIFTTFTRCFPFRSTSCKKDVVITYNIADNQLCLVDLPFALADGSTTSFNITQAQLQAAFSAASTTYSLDRITKVVAKGFKVKISGGATNLDKISGFQVFAKVQSTAGLGTMIASTSTAFATGANEVDLAIHGTDLKSFLGTEDIVITLRAYNKDSSPAICLTLTNGVIEFSASK